MSQSSRKKWACPAIGSADAKDAELLRALNPDREESVNEDSNHTAGKKYKRERPEMKYEREDCGKKYKRRSSYSLTS